MTRIEVIERARKLLALANGTSNEHEAALAGARAAELLQRFELSADALDTEGRADDDAEEPGEYRLDENGSATWRSSLASGIARAHGCYVFRRSAGWGDKQGILIVGRPSRVESCRYLYEWLAREVDQLARKRAGNGRAWLNAYRHGAVAAILEAVRAAHATAARETVRAGSSLVTLDRAVAIQAERRNEAERWARARTNLRSTRSTTSSREGYAAGKQDGGGIYGNGGRQLGAGPRLLRG